MSTASQPITSMKFVVALDYGHFYLDPGVPGVLDPDDVGSLLEEAIEGNLGIAQGSNTIVVLSPHQNNFSMPLTVELWASPPINDILEWQEVSEVVTYIGDQGLTYMPPVLQSEHIPVPAGRYRMRISGRGFVNRGWPGSTEPGDEWRFQLWPSRDSDEPRRIRRWEDSQDL